MFELKDLMFGDIITLRNEDVLVYTGIATMRNDNDMCFEFKYYDDELNFKHTSEFDIMKVERYIRANLKKICKVEVLFDREEVLKEKEKRWIVDFIRPFKDRITSITKKGNSNTKWLCFSVDDDDASFDLPFFTNDMYNGMKLNKAYTLEELKI